jgi:hypothetical protein
MTLIVLIWIIFIYLIINWVQNIAEKHFQGGVCIFVHNNIKFCSITLDTFCMDKDTEVCAIKLQLTNINI